MEIPTDLDLHVPYLSNTTFRHTWLLQWQGFALLILSIYLILVKIFRYRRLGALTKKYHHRVNPLGTLTANEAFDVSMSVALLEFPSTFIYAIRLGMFKSYAIPSISNLLARTGHFKSVESASLRAANTGALLSEIFFHPPGSPRASAAAARTNFLHSGYQASGSISNHDMLYTLAQTILEPVERINNYEWRSLTDLETDALATYWKYLGELLNISYEDLPSKTWRDGVHWLDELRIWTLEYEKQNMRFSEANHLVASKAASSVDFPLHHLIPALVSDERLSTLGFKLPSRLFRMIAIQALTIRKHVLRHLCLPRTYPIELTGIPSTTPGRYWARSWSSYPWYMKPGSWSRWSPSYLVQRIVGRGVEEDRSTKYRSEGYAIEDVGPRGLQGKGCEYMKKDIQRQNGIHGSSCPFAIGV